MAMVDVVAGEYRLQVQIEANYVAKMLKDLCKVVNFLLEVQAAGGTITVTKIENGEELN